MLVFTCDRFLWFALATGANPGECVYLPAILDSWTPGLSRCPKPGEPDLASVKGLFFVDLVQELFIVVQGFRVGQGIPVHNGPAVDQVGHGAFNFFHV